MDGVGKLGELERKQLRVRRAEQEQSRRLREGAAIDEFAVGEACEPAEVVVDRVVHASAALAAVPHVEARNPEVLEERRVVRPGSERGNPQIPALARLLAI